MNYNVFFLIYMGVVLLFWLFLVSLKLRKRINTMFFLSWMVAVANPIGQLLLIIRKFIITRGQ